jgi:hypothetical protein
MLLLGGGGIGVMLPPFFPNRRWPASSPSPGAWKVLREWIAGHLTEEVSPHLVAQREELIRELYT